MSAYQLNKIKLTEEEFFALDLKDIYIVDVRHPFELVSGSLGIANNIPFINIFEDPTVLPKDKIILTYCNYGNRAGKTAAFLQDNGYKAYSLGGYSLFSEKLKKRCSIKQ